MLEFKKEPDPSLLYLVAIFSIEPAHETRGLLGSLGRVGPNGDLGWHVEIVQARRHPILFSSGAALAVVYLRIEENDVPNVPSEDDVQRAFDLLEGLVAPKEWASQRPLPLRLLNAGTYRGTGKALGGSVYANTIWGAGSGSLGVDGLDVGRLDQHPELRRAIRFYTRGISAADERFLPDACINYARSLECLVGSSSDKAKLRSECHRLGIGSAEVIDFLDKTRGRYAIGHALDRVGTGRRKLKDLPTPDIERAGRRLAKEAISRYIDLLPELDYAAELRGGMRYAGLPPVATNLPLPREVLWAKSGPWEQAAPGMAPDLIPLTELAKQNSIRPSKIRSLVKRHLLNDFKRGRRLYVPSVMYEFLVQLKRESARDLPPITFVGIRSAAEACGLAKREVRQLIRTRQLVGYLRHRFMREIVEVNSLRYLMWRRRREKVVKALGLPNRLGRNP